MAQSELGAHPDADRDATRFCVWAPRAREVVLEVVAPSPARVPMQRREDGVFELVLPGIGPGAEYFYVLDGRQRPDPRSLAQARGVHGPSRVVDTRAFHWTDAGFRCPELPELVLYELHVGSFTPEGTFDAAIDKLGELRALGVTAVEVMPVAEFPGTRNWGYDGVLLYAPQSSYGGPEGLHRLVDACHAHGMAFVLDVVYNHVGPEGNYLREFAPYFSDRYTSPWGEAVNFDGPDSDSVRRFVIDNALYWLREYHVDALRLDAVHGIFDFSARHILAELHDEVQAQAARLGRPAYLIAESDLNDVRLIAPRAQGGYALDAQWSDDFHHALRALLTGERAGYFADFGQARDLAKAIAEGYVYDGRYSAYRRRRHGNSAREQPGYRFVVFSQNHDQVANPSQGSRLASLVDVERQKLAAAALLTAPNLPLLFMGEEFGAVTPFFYFVSHSDAGLVQAVREGRRAEHEAFTGQAEWADPQAERTFEHSKLDWACRARPPHAQVLACYRDLLALRRRHRSLHNARKDLTRTASSEAPRWLRVVRGDASGECAAIAFNFSAQPERIPLQAEPGDYELVFSTADGRYGGPKGAAAPPAQLALGADPTWVPCPPWSAVLYLKRSQP